jgi:hypothetical protein
LLCEIWPIKLYFLLFIVRTLLLSIFPFRNSFHFPNNSTKWPPYYSIIEFQSISIIFIFFLICQSKITTQ